MRVAECIDVPRPYVSARVKDQMFQLLEGHEVHIDPYYVFLARSNKNVSGDGLRIYAPSRSLHGLPRRTWEGTDHRRGSTANRAQDKGLLT
jgi:hypothetical protein